MKNYQIGMVKRLDQNNFSLRVNSGVFSATLYVRIYGDTIAVDKARSLFVPDSDVWRQMIEEIINEVRIYNDATDSDTVTTFRKYR